jgi:hypothetical protein
MYARKMLKSDTTLDAKFTIRNLPHFTWSRAKPTRLYMKKWVNFSRLPTSPTRVDLGLEKGAPGWRCVKGWPGYRVNANRNLFVYRPGLARQPGLTVKPGSCKGSLSIFDICNPNPILNFANDRHSSIYHTRFRLGMCALNLYLYSIQ